LNIKLTKPFFIRALEACATLAVDLNKVEKKRKTPALDRRQHREHYNKDDGCPKSGRNR
jgi:hypothetical protein